MRRAKLGDVYCIRVPNGYKLYQWAYRIPKEGDYIRVFDGLYDEIPTNVAEIVAGKHSYIIAFFASRAYRIGLAQLIDNLPVPEKYPFPDFEIRFWMNQQFEVFSIWVRPTSNKPTGNVNDIFDFPASSMDELPPEYQKLTLLASCVTPAWLLYLFDYDFSLSDLRRFWPIVVLGEKKDEILNGYLERVEKLLDADRERRKKKDTPNLA